MSETPEEKDSLLEYQREMAITFGSQWSSVTACCGRCGLELKGGCKCYDY